MLEATQPGGLGCMKTLAAVRLVCALWQAVHDAMVTRLVLRQWTTDAAIGMLVRRFPAVVLSEFKPPLESVALTDKGLRAVSSCTALVTLNV